MNSDKLSSLQKHQTGQHEPKLALPVRREYLFALICGVLASALSLSAFSIVRSNLKDVAQSEFNSLAWHQAQDLESSLEDKLIVLESMHSLYSATGGIPREEFGAFVEPFQEKLAGVQGLEWIARIDAAERDSFEKARRAEGFTDFEIRERNDQGTMIKAADRSEYYPIFPLGTREDNGPFGFDMASNPDRRAALEEARDTARIVTSERVTLIQEKEGQFGFLVFAPVYESEVRPKTLESRRMLLRGFVSGVFRIPDVVQAALQDFEPGEVNIELLDASAPKSKQYLFRSSVADPADAQSPESGPENNLGVTAHSREFHVANRRWLLVATPGPKFLKAHTGNGAILVLAVGLAFSALLTAYLFSLVRRTAELGYSEEVLRLTNAELEDHRTRLEELVRLRTRELEEAQAELVQKEKLATLGKLAATVSHELRNPLGTIRTSLFSARELSPNPPEDLQKALDRADRSITRCDRIIQELLDLARRPHSPIESTSLDQWLANFLDDYSVPDTVTFCRVLESNVVFAFDRERLGRSVVNVLDNACQAVEISFNGASPEVKLRTSSSDGFLIIEITDNGHGIEVAVGNKIFEPLYSTKSFGVGLGLTIVKETVEEHNGTVEVESHTGHGTSILMRFPLNPGEVA